MINDFQSRKEVWIALSDLFLDTDVTIFYDHIVNMCAKSNYTIEEMKEILVHEVGPALAFNLHDIAGEWSGFDEYWLINRIVTIRSRKQNFIIRILYFGSEMAVRRYAIYHWNIISKFIIEKRRSAQQSDASETMT